MYKPTHGIIKTAELDATSRTFRGGHIIRGFVELQNDERQLTGRVLPYSNEDVQFVAFDDDTNAPEFIGSALHGLHAEDLFTPYVGLSIACEEPTETAVSIGHWTLSTVLQAHTKPEPFLHADEEYGGSL